MDVSDRHSGNCPVHKSFDRPRLPQGDTAAGWACVACLGRRRRLRLVSCPAQVLARFEDQSDAVEAWDLSAHHQVHGVRERHAA